MNSEATKALPQRPTNAKVKKEKPAKESKQATILKPKNIATNKVTTEDAESMFKVGFLSDVYQERPIGYEGISKIVTRVAHPMESVKPMSDPPLVSA